MRQSFPDFATFLKQSDETLHSESAIYNSQVNFASAIFSVGIDQTHTDAGIMPVSRMVFDVETNNAGQVSETEEMYALSKRMQNLSSAEIRSELNLNARMTRIELQRLRRRFAASNHPDCLPKEFRVAAEQRMKTANALLDSAMASARDAL